MSSRSVHFADRRAAGRELATRVLRLALPDPVVVAVSPGGVHIGFEIARAAAGPLHFLPSGNDGASAGYRPHSPNVLNRIVLLVDDGTAPTDDLRAAARQLRHEGASRVMLATPVLRGSFVDTPEPIIDELVYLLRISDDERVEDQFGDFHEVGENEIQHFLRDLRDPHSPPAPPLEGRPTLAGRPILRVRGPPVNPA
jgi:putative phosphoribosyl transferase